MVEWSKEAELVEIRASKKMVKDVPARRLEVFPTVRVNERGDGEYISNLSMWLIPGVYVGWLEEERIQLRDSTYILKSRELRLTKDLSRLQSKQCYQLR